MTHTSRCANATSIRCTCECGGKYHGTGTIFLKKKRRIGIKRRQIATKKMRKKSKSYILPRRKRKSPISPRGIAKRIVIETGIRTFFPPIVPIYRAYRIAIIGKRIYDAYDESANKDQAFDNIMSELIKFGALEASKRISESEASQIAKGIRSAAESAEIIKQISSVTKVEEEVYSTMLEGSIRNGMLSGIKNFTLYAVESSIG